MNKPTTTTSSLPPAGRFAWLLICPALLLLTTLSIILRSGGWFTIMDLVFFAIVGMAMLGRWLEFQGDSPRTAYDEPATPGHLRRYLVAAPVVGLAIWIVANVLGNHVVPGWK